MCFPAKAKYFQSEKAEIDAWIKVISDRIAEIEGMIKAARELIAAGSIGLQNRIDSLLEELTMLRQWARELLEDRNAKEGQKCYISPITRVTSSSYQ